MDESIKQLTSYFRNGKVEKLTDAMECHEIEDLKNSIRIGNRCIVSILLILTRTQITDSEAAEIIYEAMRRRYA